MDVQGYIDERLPLVNRTLEDLLPPAGKAPSSLHAAMRHLIFPGGKRLRPMFALAAAEAVGGPSKCALPAACAVEMVHTYSLIHDDLPCMDDDVTRRGKPTVHVKYGEAVAVLAGDALLAAAFEALAPPGADPERSLGALRDLARAAGPGGLVGGQVDDLAFDPAGSAEAIESVHQRKSAALIAASVLTGARLAGGDEAQLEQLGQFGLDVGVAFQIADDLLDEADEDNCSLARALGSDAARARAEDLLVRALSRVEHLGERAEPLRQLARYAVRRDR
jgi:geranylgeranyl diphosphate synthase type II